MWKIRANNPPLGNQTGTMLGVLQKMLIIPKRFLDKPVSIMAQDGTWMCTGKAEIKSFSDYHIVVEDAVEVMLIPWTSIKKIYFRKKAEEAKMFEKIDYCEGCGDPVE